MAGDITDPEYLKEKSSDIALVTITSIDGGSNHNESTNTNDFAYTYGKLKVSEVYKGDIKISDEFKTSIIKRISFFRKRLNNIKRIYQLSKREGSIL